ncbi:hypothetical protein M0804_009245 [Polistes exclamans]|nr:hypothetical protein M0804_009245 [Polistes exclamans]
MKKERKKRKPNKCTQKYGRMEYSIEKGKLEIKKGGECMCGVGNINTRRLVSDDDGGGVMGFDRLGR